jgi:hypothetical protein
MTEDSSMKELGAAAYAKWLVVFWLGSVGCAWGLYLTIRHPDRHPLVFALSLSWMMVVVVAGSTRDLFLRMDPRRGCRFARREREGRVYRLLGAGAFCWLLNHTPLGWLNPRLKLTSRRSGLELLLREMNYAEGAHVIGGLITLGLACGCVASGHISIGLAFAFLSVLCHIYPVMAQRWNRGRVLRILRHREALASHWSNASGRQGISSAGVLH